MKISIQKITWSLAFLASLQDISKKYIKAVSQIFTSNLWKLSYIIRVSSEKLEIALDQVRHDKLS